MLSGLICALVSSAAVLSSVGAVNISGQIKLTFENGTSAFVYYQRPGYKVTESKADASAFSLELSDEYDRYNIRAFSGHNVEKYPYFGLMVNPDGPINATVPGSAGAFCLTAERPYKSRYQLGANGYVNLFGSESAIWKYDNQTQALTPTWIDNADREVELQVALFMSQNLVATTDAVAFAARDGFTEAGQLSFVQ